MRVRTGAMILAVAVVILLATAVPGVAAETRSAPPESLRLSVSPRSGPAGTLLSIKSVDRCPQLAGQEIRVTIAYSTLSDAIPSESVQAVVGADGSWIAKVSVASGMPGPARVFANCGYGEVRFDVTTLGTGFWLVSASAVPAVCFCVTTSNVLFAGDGRDYGPRPALTGPPLVGIAPNPTSGTGYWLAQSDGGVFTAGDARFFGSMGAARLAAPAVGMAATPSGRGYWLVASDGGVFAFGDARFFGSTGALRLARPVVGMAATPSGRGYWLVASDGGVFAFGDARYVGSAAGPGSVTSVVGMAATPSGRGYWLAMSTGAVFAFGDAPALGPCVEGCGTNGVVAIARTPVTTARN